MKKYLVCSLLFSVLLASCGKRVVAGRGSVTSEDRAVSGFTAIDISAPVTANIHVQPGVQSSVKLSGYKNLLEDVKTELEGSTLKITNKKFINFDTDKGVVAEIIVSSLSGLGIHGAADAIVDGSITGGDFKLKISGAGDVSIRRINVSNLAATISGAGDVNIETGSTNIAHFQISGAGNINSYGLQANEVTAKVSGAGDMQVTALKTLEARVSGAGSIHYKGQPSLKSQTSGIGEIAAAE